MAFNHADPEGGIFSHMKISRFQTVVKKTIQHWFPHVEIIENYRPDWLNKKEIDLFIPSLKIAIEVNGRQHYYYCPDLHREPMDFIRQRMRDIEKKKIIKDRGLHLVIVRPFRGKYAGYGAMRDWISGIFKKEGLPISLIDINDELRNEWRDVKKIHKDIWFSKAHYDIKSFLQNKDLLKPFLEQYPQYKKVFNVRIR